jgi:hypothetical protein
LQEFRLDALAGSLAFSIGRSPLLCSPFLATGWPLCQASHPPRDHPRHRVWIHGVFSGSLALYVTYVVGEFRVTVHAAHDAHRVGALRRRRGLALALVMTGVGVGAMAILAPAQVLGRA